ncbi:HxsD-like protein [Pseudobutyrivibrio sp.]|uniref:HxsD-like protein n=1 Tax=Pseudobutyrivibrio sp. TaxID=2014367 RepID=UPI0025F59E87|nr:HxsD-like protein [Pseudobutyrivibrio sp.]
MNNQDFLKFTKEFYDNEALILAAKAYDEIAKIKITEDEQYFYCHVISCKYNVALVLNEFANYVLGTMNK